MAALPLTCRLRDILSPRRGVKKTLLPWGEGGRRPDEGKSGHGYWFFQSYSSARPTSSPIEVFRIYCSAVFVRNPYDRPSKDFKQPAFQAGR
jgi:hypothetical protein